MKVVCPQCQSKVDESKTVLHHGNWCRDCYNAYQREYMREYRKTNPQRKRHFEKVLEKVLNDPRL